jgi:chaperonin GroEL
MSKKIIKGQAGMIEGINAVADTIKVTLGPKGKCVAIQSSFGGPDITRDGATVAKGISLKDPIQSMGAELIKNAAVKTEEQAGDSTSSTAILVQEFVRRGSRFIQDPEVNMNELKDGMEKAVEETKAYISKTSEPVADDLEKIRRVATISANNDKAIGNLIVEAMEKVGIDGVITADFGSGLDTSIEVTQGFKILRGWASPHFVTSQSDAKCVLENPVILVVSERLSTIPPLAPVLEAIAKQGRELLIIADEVDDIVLNMLAFNNIQGALKCCVVKGIDFGDSRRNIMEDISVSVGAHHVCPEYGLSMSDVTLEMLGSAEKAVISKDTCIIYDGHGDADQIKDRLEVIKDRLKDPSVSDYEKTKFKARISGLSGGVAVIRAGGASDTEKKNRKATIEDAILASQSAISEGVVPGGGWTLVKASTAVNIPDNATESEKLGYHVILDSLPVITKTIAENYGISGEVVVAKTLEGDQGFNAKTGTWGDLKADGVLDSAKALRVALENAVSAAGMCLLTDAVVYDEPEDPSK